MINSYAKIIKQWQEEYEAYKKRPSKASSLRLRKIANTIKKETTAFKKYMIELSKTGH